MVPNPQADLAIQPITVLEQAFQKLRALIMIGEFLPGDKLGETELAARMHISRPTFREMLRRLEAERLVDIVPNRGAFVTRLSLDGLAEIHEVWRMLMARAVYRFTERRDAEQIAMLKSWLAEIETAGAGREILAYLEKTNRFFAVILAGCGNRVLADSVRNLVSRINFLRARSMVLPSRFAECTSELKRLFEAIRRRKPVSAQEAVSRHIDAACAAARTALEQHGSIASIAHFTGFRRGGVNS